MSHKQVESKSPDSSPLSSPFFFKGEQTRVTFLVRKSQIWGEKEPWDGPVIHLLGVVWRTLRLNQIGSLCRRRGDKYSHYSRWQHISSLILILSSFTWTVQDFQLISWRVQGVCSVELNSSIMQDKPKRGRGGWGNQTWWCCLQRALPGLVKPSA